MYYIINALSVMSLKTIKMFNIQYAHPHGQISEYKMT